MNQPMSVHYVVPRLAQGASGRSTLTADATASGLAPGEGLLGRLGHTLFSPSKLVTDSLERRHARLLAAINTVAGGLLLFGAIECHFAAPPQYADRVALHLSIAFGVAVAAYIVSRSRHVVFATVLTILMHWLIPVSMILLRNLVIPSMPGDGFAFAAWFALSILFTGALARPWHVALIGASTVIFAASSAAFAGEAEVHQITQACAFLTNVAVLTFVFSRHRDRVEADRSAQLRARNVELLALKRTLEERVEARTADLQKSHDDLDRAYQALQTNQRSLLLSEKMASLGRLTAGIAHEMSTPIAAVRAALSETSALVDEYSRSIDDPDVTDHDHRAIAADMRDALDLAKRSSERAAAFVRSIKSQTRNDGGADRVVFDVGSAVRDCLQMLSHAASAAHCRVHFRCPEERIELFGAPGKLGQVVTNLVTNALDASGERGGGEVKVDLRRKGKDLLLSVTDDGPGISAENAARIFDPLFTTKPIGKGTGLGLTIVHDIVHGELRGHIDVRSVPGKGARFTVVIPEGP